MKNQSFIIVKTATGRAVRFALRAAIVLLLIVGLLFTSPAAMARPKKKKDEVAEATKSYVLPYMIVMMLVGVGLMTVCRPGRRKDRPDDKKRDDD